MQAPTLFSQPGKTHIALGLGLAACQKGRKVRFTTAAALVHELIEAVDERRLQRLQKQLITSQLPIDAWHDVIREPTFADAILDRLVHNAYRIELDGQSMRKTNLKTGDENAQN